MSFRFRVLLLRDMQLDVLKQDKRQAERRRRGDKRQGSDSRQALRWDESIERI